MEIRERKFDVILLDVDGTLLDFGMSEKQGMKVVLEQYGFEPTEERLLLYHAKPYKRDRQPDAASNGIRIHTERPGTAAFLQFSSYYFSREEFLVVGFLYMYVPPAGFMCGGGRRFCVQDGPGGGRCVWFFFGAAVGVFSAPVSKMGCF